MTDIDSEYIYDGTNPNFNVVYYCHYELENNLFCNKFSPYYDYYCDDHFKDKILSDKFHDINVHKKYLITEIKKLLSEISFSKTKLQRINIITTTYKLLCAGEPRTGAHRTSVRLRPGFGDWPESFPADRPKAANCAWRGAAAQLPIL